MASAHDMLFEQFKRGFYNEASEAEDNDDEEAYTAGQDQAYDDPDEDNIESAFEEWYEDWKSR